MSTVSNQVFDWANELLAGVSSITSLNGGANNQLFLCSNKKSSIVVKVYREEPSGVATSRLNAEVKFLERAKETCAGRVPDLLYARDAPDMIAMTTVEGAPYKSPTDVTQSDINEAINFYRKINLPTESLTSYAVAARDGYLCLSEHVRDIDDRINRLTVSHVPFELRSIAIPAIDQIKRGFHTAMGSLEALTQSGDIWDCLPLEHRQLSPGDFGFHNALKTRSGPVFIDFEYAGIDDPAKTVADFFLQPKVPIARAYIEMIINSFAIFMPPKELRKRTMALMQLMSVKWAAIILSPFDPARYENFALRNEINLKSALLERVSMAQRKTVLE